MSDTANAPTKTPLVVAMTGHRPDKLGGYRTPNPLYDIVVNGIIKAYEEIKPDYVITGMALGVDQWAAEICLNMGIPFVAAIPFEGQEKKWPPASQSKYHWLMSQAFQKVFVCDPGWAPWKMQKRNEWMVTSAQEVIAVWDGSTGGTANCLAAAQAAGKKIHYVPLPPAGMPVGHIPNLQLADLFPGDQSAAVSATKVYATKTSGSLSSSPQESQHPLDPKRIIDL